MSVTRNALLEAINSRRSVRKYTEEPVSREELLAVLEAGRWAPSGLNNQPWRFLVIHAGDPRQAALAGCTKYTRILLAARALILVFLDKSRMYDALKDHQAAGACIQNMLLAIHAQGLGGVWIGEILNQSEDVFKVLSLDAHDVEFMAVIALGRPAGPGVSSRRDLDEFLLEPL
jgi:nitroreductase